MVDPPPEKTIIFPPIVARRVILRIVLIYTPARPSVPNYFPPIGLMSIAAYLESNGFEVKLLDNAKERNIDWVISECQKFKPAIIGIGGIITAYQHTLELSSKLKADFPETPLVIGGQIVTGNDHNLFDHAPIDYTIHGYGEIPFLKLCEAVRDNSSEEIKKIPGVTHKAEDGKLLHQPGRLFFDHMDELPYPAYHLIDMEYYSTSSAFLTKLTNYLRINNRPNKVDFVRAFPVMATRGCTDKCTFCIHEQEFVGFKRHSLEYLRKHLQFLIDNYGINLFGIGEEMVITNKASAVNLAHMMNKHFPNCFWQTATRADFLTEENVNALSKSNCIAVGYGYESGSQKILDLYWKRTTRQQNIDAYRRLEASPMFPGGSLMVGMVGEDFQTVEDTCRSIVEAGMHSPAVFYATPYPGARLFDWAIEQGIITDSHQYLLDCTEFEPIQHMAVNLTEYRDWVVRFFHARINGEVFRFQFKKGHLKFNKALISPYGLMRLGGFLTIPLFRILKTCEPALEWLLKKPEKARPIWKTDSKKALDVDRLYVGELTTAMKKVEEKKIYDREVIEIHDMR